MDQASRSALTELLLNLLPADGATIGNQALRQQFLAAIEVSGQVTDDGLFGTPC